MKDIFRTRRLVYAAAFTAVAALLPFALHSVPDGGRLLLPMHIGVFLAGFTAGPVWGAVCGVAAPLLSHFLITPGMPPVPTLYYMMFELFVYGVTAGLFFNKLRWNVTVSLLCAQVCGRLGNMLAVLALSGVFAPKAAAWVVVWQATLTGMPGIAAQLAVVPIIMLVFEKAGLSNVAHNRA